MQLYVRFVNLLPVGCKYKCLIAKFDVIFKFFIEFVNNILSSGNKANLILDTLTKRRICDKNLQGLFFTV